MPSLVHTQYSNFPDTLINHDRFIANLSAHEIAHKLGRFGPHYDANIETNDAGGHRGTFLAEGESVLVDTMVLVPQEVDAVSLPVLVSGGIMDARGVVAALALGTRRNWEPPS